MDNTIFEVRELLVRQDLETKKVFIHCGSGWEASCEELSKEEIARLILCLKHLVH